jgi:hypothetical protein
MKLLIALPALAIVSIGCAGLMLLGLVVAPLLPKDAKPEPMF